MCLLLRVIGCVFGVVVLFAVDCCLLRLYLLFGLCVLLCVQILLCLFEVFLLCLSVYSCACSLLLVVCCCFFFCSMARGEAPTTIHLQTVRVKECQTVAVVAVVADKLQAKSKKPHNLRRGP